MKRALITGISGQDGSYLAQHLLKLGYRVHGLVRRDPETIQHLYKDTCDITFHYGDMTDEVSLAVALRKADPDEVYNLAAQVFIPTSWAYPSTTFDINVGGLARLLRVLDISHPNTRVYQASSSEMYGNWGKPASEMTPFNPVSPYGVSKLAAHELCRVYREKGRFVCCGILFNHESPRRGFEMVTRKIVHGLAAWAFGDRTPVTLGSLDAKRDWGFAGDYVRAMHLMLQQETAKDYVIATGESHSVQEFVEATLDELWIQTGQDVFRDSEHLGHFIKIDQHFVRPNEIRNLVGDSNHARHDLSWLPDVNFRGLVKMMVAAELEDLRERPWQVKP